jgi:hypothetical protein
MAEDLDQLMQDIPEACAEDDRLENFRSALFELKYNISHIEKKYPFLGTELSSLCEETITRLPWPSSTEMSSVEMETASLPLPVAAGDIAVPDAPAVEVTFSVGPSGPPVIEVTPGPNNNGNRVAYSIDAAGGILVKGLDKMGDGIIMAFEKLLSLGPKSRKEPPVMEPPVMEPPAMETP